MPVNAGKLFSAIRFLLQARSSLQYMISKQNCHVSLQRRCIGMQIGNKNHKCISFCFFWLFSCIWLKLLQEKVAIRTKNIYHVLLRPYIWRATSVECWIANGLPRLIYWSRGNRMLMHWTDNIFLGAYGAWLSHSCYYSLPYF